MVLPYSHFFSFISSNSIKDMIWILKSHVDKNINIDSGRGNNVNLKGYQICQSIFLVIYKWTKITMWTFSKKKIK